MADFQKRRPQESRDGADRSLLARVASGDRQALHTLYVKYYQRLLRFLYRMTGQLEFAQEGVNDVMLVVWDKAGSFGGRSTVSTWIMGIAYRKGLKILEKSRRWSDRFKTVRGFMIHEHAHPRGPSVPSFGNNFLSLARAWNIRVFTVLTGQPAISLIS